MRFEHPTYQETFSMIPSGRFKAGTPVFEDKNLDAHWRRHPCGEKDHDCWCEICGLPDAETASKLQYEQRALDVHAYHWLRFNATWWDQEDRAYFFDLSLVQIITSRDEKSIISCFHQHFDRPHQPGSTKRPIGELAPQLMKSLRNKVASNIVKSLHTGRIEEMPGCSDLTDILRLELAEMQTKPGKNR